mmetsp:Transcript_43287/g.80438  ORF Transcript_43287/g.80438 Transcript_43287/m.80438 type:complete len:205 (-) Transcript_43287:274-888(-)
MHSLFVAKVLRSSRAGCGVDGEVGAATGAVGDVGAGAVGVGGIVGGKEVEASFGQTQGAVTFSTQFSQSKPNVPHPGGQTVQPWQHKSVPVVASLTQKLHSALSTFRSTQASRVVSGTGSHEAFELNVSSRRHSLEIPVGEDAGVLVARVVEDTVGGREHGAGVVELGGGGAGVYPFSEGSSMPSFPVVQGRVTIQRENLQNCS